MGTRRTILIADDHTLVREGLRALVSADPDLAVVGEANDGRKAVELTVAAAPDLVVLDLEMPRTSGLDALREIKARCPRTRVLVLTAHKAEERVFVALAEGADGYLHKECTSAELLLGIRSALAGEKFLGASVTSQVVSAYLDAKREAGLSASPNALSVREEAVLKLVAEGYRTRQIAEHLFLSQRTVEKHRASLMRKLNRHSVASLTAYALERGLVAR